MNTRIWDNPNFFTVHYQRGMQWYEQTYFADAGKEKAVGEFSNSYIVYPQAIERIAKHLLQLIIGLYPSFGR